MNLDDFENTDCFKQLANELDGEFGGGLLGPKAIVPPGVANPGFDEHYDEASNGSGSKVDMNMEPKTSKEGQQQRFRSEKDFSTIDPTFNMIRVIVNDFGDQCSLHGIYALFSKRSIFAKLLWAVAILFMNGLFFFYLLDLMEDAVLKSPAATTTSLSYEQQSMVRFPRLTICDPSPDISKMDAYFEGNAGPALRFILGIAYNPMFAEVKNDLQEDVAAALAKHTGVVVAFNEQVNMSNITAAAKAKYMLGDDLESTMVMWSNYDFNFDYDSVAGSTIDMFRATTPVLLELVMFCTWKGVDCRTADAWSQYLTPSGFCWVFTPDDDKVYTAGQAQALHLILDTMADDGSAVLHNYLGVSFDIKDRDKSVTVSDDSQQILLSPGVSYLLSFRISEFLDDSDTMDCIYEGSPGHLTYFDQYSFSACIDECASDAEIGSCGCRELGMPFKNASELPASMEHLAGPQVCNMYKGLMCNMNKTEILKNCYQQCKPQCNFSRYDFQMSFGAFPAPLAAVYNMPVFFGDEIEYEYMAENMVEVRMFLDDMFIMKSYVQRKYEIFSIISNAGGLAGLFTGASMLTVFEIVEVSVNVLHLLIIRMSHNFNRRYRAQVDE
ncbi:acid-sensing ion channel 1-like [Symsagittifera roscoffensis]|uniref:acid-sensing ion channel 1-like n=1 Tax=Symsagittifera roscoffensis TaxID=84072 RepID=UPI00307C3935